MAWTKALAGWMQIEDWAPNRTTYVVSTGENGVALRIPLGEGKHLFAEARLRRGYDAILPSEGVLLSGANERRTQGRGLLRVIGPKRVIDVDRTLRLGPHWDAALQPGQEHTYKGFTVRVVERAEAGFVVEVVRSRTDASDPTVPPSLLSP
jgi:hypothetical protein